MRTNVHTQSNLSLFVQTTEHPHFSYKMNSNMIATYTSNQLDDATLKHQHLSHSIASKNISLQYESTNQDVSYILDLQAFNHWIENEASSMCHSFQDTSDEKLTSIQHKSALAAEADKLKTMLQQRKIELQLALAKRDLLSGPSCRTKNNTTQPKSFRKKISHESTNSIRINGVSKRRGSYNNIMHQLAESPLFYVESNAN